MNLKVPQLLGIWFIIFVIVTVTILATSQYSMNYTSLSIYIHTEMGSTIGSILLADHGVARHYHPQNVDRSRSNTQCSDTLRATSPLCLSTFKYSQTPLQLSKILSDSARAFSGASESTCCYEGAFRMLRDLTYRIVKF